MILLDKASAKVMSKRRVFVLGAGSSRAFGIPNDRDLLRLVLSRSKMLQPPLLPMVSRSKFRTFESIYSNLSLQLDFHELVKDEVQSKFIAYTCDQLLKRMAKVLWRAVRHAYKNELLQRFIRQLRSGDVIISFNYDTLIEAAIIHHNSLKKGGKITWCYGSLSPEDCSVSIFKLHGSLNWFDFKAIEISEIPKGITIENIRRFSNSKYSRRLANWKRTHLKPFKIKGELFRPISGYWNILASTLLRDVPNIQPLLVPPTSKKIFENVSLREMWGDAASSIINVGQSGGNMYVIGYSFPHEDMLSRILLKWCYDSFMLNKFGQVIHVINPDSNNLKREIHNWFGPEVRFENITFEKWIRRNCP